MTTPASFFKARRALRTCVWLVSLMAVPLGASSPAPSAGDPGTVTLPLGEYDRLVARAQSRPKRVPEAPLAAVVTHTELRARVDAGLVRGSLSISGEVLRPGPVRVALVSGGTLLTDVRLGGPPAAGRTLGLLRENDSVYAVLQGEGAFALILDWAAAVASEPGRATLALPVPYAGSAKAWLDLPGEPAELLLDAGAVTARRVVAGRTLLEATLATGQPARLAWSARDANATQQATRAARLLSDVKTLLTLGEAEEQLAALVDVTVVEGQPETLTFELPAGFELVGASGPTLDTLMPQEGRLTLGLRERERRRHQFLLTLTRAAAPGSYRSEVGWVTLVGSQRETGELGVLGTGTLDLEAHASGTLKRIDVSEAGAALRGLAREPLLMAFRYHRRSGEGPQLALGVRRFDPAGLLAALCERAEATTLVTREGRTLTEVRLTVRNQAQPFLRVTLPTGVTLLSADVAGQPVKPAQGPDGTRVPLLRAGFKPDGPYTVTFVYLQSGVPFAKRGDARLNLPRFDVPVTRLDWELFLPDGFQVERFAGDLERTELVDHAGSFQGAALGFLGGVESGVQGGAPGGVVRAAATPAAPPPPKAVDELVAREAQAENRPALVPRQRQELPATQNALVNAPSENVLSLQRRVAGVLPVRVEVPRTGSSHRFVRALVLDEESALSFRYKLR